jgi:hypothetical protein
MDILRDKRTQAKQWLEKLKRTVSMPKGGPRAPSQRLAHTGDAAVDDTNDMDDGTGAGADPYATTSSTTSFSGAADGSGGCGMSAFALSAGMGLGGGSGSEGKLALSEMKQLVDVGENVFLIEEEGGASSGGGGAGSRSTMAQSSRELAKAQSVVEIAEDVSDSDMTVT